MERMLEIAVSFFTEISLFSGVLGLGLMIWLWVKDSAPYDSNIRKIVILIFCGHLLLNFWLLFHQQ